MSERDGDTGMAPLTDEPMVTQSKLQQVFSFLKALHDLRNPVKRQVKEQPWLRWFKDFPEHPLVRVGLPTPATTGDADGHGDDVVLTVGRPSPTPAPAPPAVIADWLWPGWDKPSGDVQVQAEKSWQEADGPRVVRFDDDADRVQALGIWRTHRDAWVLTERPTRRAIELFEALYDLRAELERASEQRELVLGDGLLRWDRQDGDIHHPILLQRLELDFDASVPEFILRPAEYLPELYAAVFRVVDEVDGQTVAQFRARLSERPLHPLDDEATSAFLRAIIQEVSAQGRFIDHHETAGTGPGPTLSRSPVIFLRNRSQGFATAIETILDDLAAGGAIPPALQRVVGVETPLPPLDGSQAHLTGNDDDTILLSKPANQEQLAIAQRLDRYGNVLVQGPPGTGKTHTIANLIGHLLSQGKTVLVTSHTTKALRVLHHQIDPQLQPLCVSLLDHDADSRAQLERSVNAIVGTFSATDAETLDRKAADLAQQRQRILADLRRTRAEVLEARAGEYRDIAIGPERWRPADAARLIARSAEADGWIPIPVTLGVPLPLTPGEVEDLYSTNVLVRPEDERALAHALPDPARLPDPATFRRLVDTLQGLEAGDLDWRTDLWEPLPAGAAPVTREKLETLLGHLQQALQPIDPMAANSWRLNVVVASMQGGGYREVWVSLAALIRQVSHEAGARQEIILAHGPQLCPETPLDEQLQHLDAILAHLATGRSLSGLTLLMNGAWRRLLKIWRVGDREPVSSDHFLSLAALCQLTLARRQLLDRWARQVTAVGGPGREELGPQPEVAAEGFVTVIEQCLSWYGSTWKPLETAMSACGFRWQILLQEQPPDPTPRGQIVAIARTVIEQLPRIFAALGHRLRQRELLGIARNLQAHLGEYGSHVPVVVAMAQAVAGRDVEAYAQAFDRLLDLGTRRQHLQRRRQLLQTLEAAAPAWAAAIRERRPDHDGDKPPGDAEAAWVWRQLHDALEVRHRKPVDELQRRCEQLTVELQRVTVSLVDALAWAAQLRRTSLSQQQALMGWQGTIRRMGKGTTKRMAVLQAEARRLMAESRTAVPVWIMPLSRVVDNFDPRSARFDVVIIDEASQSDVMGLIACYLGQQVVVVGDDKQVSPDAVGQNLDGVEHLIAEHLQGIPNKALYDGRMSVYDLAEQSFGGKICLIEHFRCVPDIIQFSNRLSYDYRIKPLREDSGVALKPHVVSVPVADGLSEGKVNRAEAEQVVALLVAATEQPEYAGRTMGVISLLGDDQADRIDRLLRVRLSTADYEARRIVCGNAAQFQGDERDVMFLSMVDSGKGDGPLSLRSEDNDLYRKRYNVAASRARDQMWVVHSLRPEVDLKPQDIRLALIRHAEDPQAATLQLAEQEAKADSEFEKLVMRRLMAAGFKVTAQWKVGAYRIDLVVEGNGKRLAVECDGDRYHPVEKLPEDMARQAILERLGWRFVRIRGSEFFRDADRAMVPVFERLKALEIPPEAATGAAPRPESDLLARVLARAAALRAEWAQPAASPSPAIVSPPPEPVIVPPPPVPAALLGGSDGRPPSIDDVAESTIVTALLSHLQGRGTVEMEDLLREANRTLGFSRLGKNIRIRLQATLTDLCRAGRISMEATAICLAVPQEGVSRS